LRCRAADLARNTFVDAGLAPSHNIVPSAPGMDVGQSQGALGYETVPRGEGDPRDPTQPGQSERDVIDAKLRSLSLDLQTNNTSDTKSSCFWCTCEFSNPPVHLPKHRLERSYQCYGCFCSPECAAAHLFSEDLDAACRFERFHLLNHIYRKVYGYKESIKPAPDPRYTLDKFYGNLTIEEYRRHCTRAGVLLVVDQPLTRVLPELYVESGDRALSAGTGRYRLRRRAPQSKAEILNQNFRLAPPPQPPSGECWNSS